MSILSANNKRIAKNTLLLYLRMFFTMSIGLFTSRIVLNTLGVSDYGIYNVVAGIITMLSFLNAGMVASSQRFISYTLGNGNSNRLKNVFCTSINIHIVIALIAFIVGETIGLWFINTQLNIETERMIAANWVYQCSLLTFIISVISVPYNSCVVAHEKMSAFAYISILEVILKLAVAYILLITPFDKLITYSILVLSISVLIRSCYTLYCKLNFEECNYRFYFDKSLFKEMFSFAGWSVLGNMGFSFKDQVSNIILNIFYGTTLNAARSIGIQVSTLVNTFSTNLTMALNPQITKQYAAGNVDESRNLVYTGSRYTFYLLTLISIPIIINVDYLLRLWLGIVPEYTSKFLVLSLITSLLYAVSGCVTIALQATGNIKTFQIGISVLMLSELPIAYILLENECPPYSVMYPTIISYTIAIFFRFFLINKYLQEYKMKDYFNIVLIPCLIIYVLSYCISRFVRSYILVDNLVKLIGVIFISIIITSSLIYIFGVNKNERILIKQLLIKKMCFKK